LGSSQIEVDVEPSRHLQRSTTCKARAQYTTQRTCKRDIINILRIASFLLVFQEKRFVTPMFV